MEPSYIPEPQAPLTTEQKIDKILTLVVDVHSDVADLKTDVKELRQTVDSHTSTLDGMAKRLNEVATNTVGLIQSRDRHEKSIKQLATKVGVKLDW